MLFEKAQAAVRFLPFVKYRPLQGGTFPRREGLSPRQEALERFRRYCSYLPEVAPEPVFVKIGANDGITGDP